MTINEIVRMFVKHGNLFDPELIIFYRANQNAPWSRGKGFLCRCGDLVPERWGFEYDDCGITLYFTFVVEEE